MNSSGWKINLEFLSGNVLLKTLMNREGFTLVVGIISMLKN